MSMHTDFARPSVRRWIARNKPCHAGDSVVLLVALILLWVVI